MKDLYSLLESEPPEESGIVEALRQGTAAAREEDGRPLGTGPEARVRAFAKRIIPFTVAVIAAIQYLTDNNSHPLGRNKYNHLYWFAVAKLPRYCTVGEDGYGWSPWPHHFLKIVEENGLKVEPSLLEEITEQEQAEKENRIRAGLKEIFGQNVELSDYQPCFLIRRIPREK